MKALKATLAHPLLRAGGVYFLANIINAVLPFALLPVLTRFLTPADYGIVAMFGVMTAMIIPFVGINAHASVTRQYYRRDELDFPSYVANALGLSAVGFVVVMLAMLALASPISRFTDFPATWIWAIPTFALAHFLVTLRLTVFQLERRPVPYALVQVGLTALELALALLLVVRVGLDWEGRVLSRLVATIAFAVLALGLLARGGWLRMRIDRSHISHALRFGVPLIPHTLGLWAMTLADRLFITEFVGIDETGIYTVGAQIAMAISLVTTAFSAAWTPWLFERLKANTAEDRRRVVHVSWLYAGGLVILGLAVALLGPPALQFLVGAEFLSAGRYIIWLAAAKVFHGLYQLVAGYLFYVEKTGTLTKITLLASLVNLVLNYVLVKSYGGIGAAYATLVAYFVYFLVTLFVARAAYPMPWNPFAPAERS